MKVHCFREREETKKKKMRKMYEAKSKGLRVAKIIGRPSKSRQNLFVVRRKKEWGHPSHPPPPSNHKNPTQRLNTFKKKTPTLRLSPSVREAQEKKFKYYILYGNHIFFFVYSKIFSVINNVELWPNLFSYKINTKDYESRKTGVVRVSNIKKISLLSIDLFV